MKTYRVVHTEFRVQLVEVETIVQAPASEAAAAQLEVERLKGREAEAARLLSESLEIVAAFQCEVAALKRELAK